MKERFLERLRENLADLTTWLVYADWLEEQDDPTSAFIRLSLDLSDGRFPATDGEARMRDFGKLFGASDLETRELMSVYRSSLPTRFRVLRPIFIPRFGEVLTIASGFLESGRVKRGMDLGVGTRADGRPQLLQMIESFRANHDEVAAGCEPISLGLVWWPDRLPIEIGSVLTETPAVSADPGGE